MEKVNYKELRKEMVEELNKLAIKLSKYEIPNPNGEYNDELEDFVYPPKKDLDDLKVLFLMSKLLSDFNDTGSELHEYYSSYCWD